MNSTLALSSTARFRTETAFIKRSYITLLTIYITDQALIIEIEPAAEPSLYRFVRIKNDLIVFRC